MKKEIATKKNSNKEIALHYMKSLVDVARESFLILNPDMIVIMANPTFYANFHVRKEETESISVYNLGNGQWNIPELRKLLEEILPQKKIIKDYEVKHNFPTIGLRTMQLNGRQIDSVQLIILAIEDITEKKELQNKMADYTKSLEIEVTKRTSELASRLEEVERLNKSMIGRELKMVELKKEIAILKKRVKNGNGKNGNNKNGNNKEPKK